MVIEKTHTLLLRAYSKLAIEQSISRLDFLTRFVLNTKGKLGST